MNWDAVRGLAEVATGSITLPNKYITILVVLPSVSVHHQYRHIVYRDGYSCHNKLWLPMPSILRS